MNEAAAFLTLEIGGRHWRIGAEQHDLSIPLAFDRPQPQFFGVPPALERVVRAGAFVGDVREGGSCNCATYTLTPHCNGTHTECIGHITSERVSVREASTKALHVALLVTIEPMPSQSTEESTEPAPHAGDMLITRAALERATQALAFPHFRALVIRTLPNEAAKLARDYDATPAPFMTAEAMRWIVERDVEHLVVDVPSVDRANDEGRLTTHRIFWNVPRGARTATNVTRNHATITELAYIADHIKDGPYLLNLQVAPFIADAAPSRPILLTIAPL
jgi:kynurenine formamidase